MENPVLTVIFLPASDTLLSEIKALVGRNSDKLSVSTYQLILVQFWTVWPVSCSAVPLFTFKYHVCRWIL
jgi:hypothetical protein